MRLKRCAAGPLEDLDDMALKKEFLDSIIIDDNESKPPTRTHDHEFSSFIILTRYELTRIVSEMFVCVCVFYE